MANDITVWGIHAGQSGEADSLFLHKNMIALGFNPMGDLSALAPSREAFKERALQRFPESKPGAIPIFAGQTFRFVHEVKIGDLVAYPSQHDKKIHVGRIEGAYRYDPAANSDYPNMRQVTWIAKAPRTDFGQGALYEIGSAMSFFQLKNYADEFVALTAGDLPPVPIDVDPTVSLVASEVEQ